MDACPRGTFLIMISMVGDESQAPLLTQAFKILFEIDINNLNQDSENGVSVIEFEPKIDKSKESDDPLQKDEEETKNPVEVKKWTHYPHILFLT